ncbi:MAG TPA: NAD(P)-binding protein [Planctomycetaceae bacterium]|nr:NAD(P)-binding protein [Planctomycetaceae bacterium]
MPLRLSNIRLPVDRAESELPGVIARRLGCPADEIVSCRILRKSLDARSRRDLRFVYTAAVELADESQREASLLRRPDVAWYRAERFDDPPPGGEPLPQRPIVVGSGPAGLLAAYYLALKGYRPLVIERGRPVKERVPAIRAFDAGGPHDPEDNYLFGEGGAGCFSDGKLTCRISGPDVNWVLERFVECGGRPSIVYEHRPHLGSNRLPLICRNFRRRIEALGGEYRFGCRLEQIVVRDGRVAGIGTSSGPIPTTQLVLAIGHSARDTYRMLLALGVPLRAKGFQLGLRIEQPQEQVNRHKYGRPDYLELLGAADYTLVAHGQRDVYTFCMCAGGSIIPSVSEPEMFCTNGMSSSRHDTPFANSGLVVTLEPHEFGASHPLAGVELQRRYESAAFRLAGGDYECPIQTAGDFLAGRAPDPQARLVSSYQRGNRPVDLAQVIPPPIVEAIRRGLPVMDRRWQGEFLRNAILVGPEMRGSSPVRIDRDPHSRECPGLAGLYPVGEGAGYAGGIVTAAVDGLRSARRIVKRFAAIKGDAALC